MSEQFLDELKNDITHETPASFEPSIDYVVTKIPRFAFEKFPQATRRSVRSEIFVATRATQFPGLGGAAYFNAKAQSRKGFSSRTALRLGVLAPWR